MRLLHVTDFHFRKHWFKWTAEQALKFDAVCFSGDFLDLFKMHDISLRDQAKWVRGWIKSWPSKVPLGFASGNHDFWNKSEIFLDGDAEVGWLAKCRRPGEIFGDGDVLDRWIVQMRTTRWGMRPLYAVEYSVLVNVVHQPPPVELLALKLDVPPVQQPEHSLILCGHEHSPRSNCFRVGRHWLLNPGVGNEEQEVPNHIIVDFIDMTATSYVGEIPSKEVYLD